MSSVDWPDHQARAVPIDVRSLHSPGLAIPGAGVTLGPYEMSGYNSVTVTIYNSGANPILAKGQWDFFDSPLANSITEQQVTVAVGADPKYQLWQNQGTLFSLVLSGVGGATTGDIYIARSNQSPFPSSSLFLELITDAGGRAVPVGAAYSVYPFNGIPGNRFNADPGAWTITLAGADAVAVHALEVGTYLVQAMGTWAAPVGAYYKSVSLATANTDGTLVQNTPSEDSNAANETHFNLSSILYVHDGFNNVAGNITQLLAQHGHVAPVLITDARLILWRLSGKTPFV